MVKRVFRVWKVLRLNQVDHFLFFSFPEVENKDSIKVEMYSKLRQKQFKGLVQVFKIGFAQLLLEKMLKCQILFGSLRTNKLTTNGT